MGADLSSGRNSSWSPPQWFNRKRWSDDPYWENHSGNNRTEALYGHGTTHYKQGSHQWHPSKEWVKNPAHDHDWTKPIWILRDKKRGGAGGSSGPGTFKGRSSYGKKTYGRRYTRYKKYSYKNRYYR